VHGHGARAWWIARRAHSRFTAPEATLDIALLIVGVACAAAGLVLVVWSNYHFWTRGRGTLAPWDPPRRFVVSGPYRFVRNPMISGVILLLLAEACGLRSTPHVEWAGLFTLINAVYIPALEEPTLRARFGDAYERYTRTVRRFVPRLTPYRPSRLRLDAPKPSCHALRARTPLGGSSCPSPV
jgi:protein-S-isoprenylcysteine O-methyltransferase Ste14